MDDFTFIPVWVIQDLIILIVAAITTFFIVKKEEHPIPILLEGICFVFLYAAVYENFATWMGWYGFGRSIVMVFNVPITVPIIEYLLVYTSLRLLEYTNIKTWFKPLIVGFFGMILDFTLDPLAIKQVYDTNEGIIGRWTWFIGPNDVNIYGEPVYNFSGWVLICGFAAAMILLGRWWFKKSNYNSIVGYAYPFLALMGALLLLASPLSKFLLWLEPFFQKGSIAEWIMLAVYFGIAMLILAVFWRGRMMGKISLREEFPIFLVFLGFNVFNIIFTIIGGYFDILWIVLLFTFIQAVVVLGMYYRSRSVTSGYSIASEDYNISYRTTETCLKSPH